jgi:SAM-dependent methyltransferase
MALEARRRLAGITGFAAYNADVQALPFAAGAFDIVVANHMLYHVPSLPRAVNELAWVLAPGGRLYAATNGPMHLRELYELAAGYAPWRGPGESMFSFRLDNAEAVLGETFGRVEVRRYADALWVTEAQPVVDYLTSMSSFPDLAGRVPPEKLLAEVQKRIDADGGLSITKEAGLALAWKD